MSRLFTGKVCQQFIRGLLCIGCVHLLLLSDCALSHDIEQVNVNEQRISQHNDSRYVSQVMRLAKSAEMRNFMNTEYDQCENFYEFACGSWARINPAETTPKRKTSIFDLLEASYKQKQLRVLNAEIKTDEENDVEDSLESELKQSAAFTKVRHFYASCRNMAKVKQSVFREQIKQIIEEFGSMPAQFSGENSDWETSNEAFDWLDTIGKIQNKYGIDIILQLGVRMDFENKTRNALFVGQPGLKLKSKSVYLGVATENYRRKYLKDIATNLEKFLGLSADYSEQIAREILDFEIELAKGLFDLRTDITLRSESVKRTPQELQLQYLPEIDLLRFTNLALGYDLNTTCYEYTPGYQANLARVISSTTNTQLANYIFYNLAERFFVDTDKNYIEMEEMCLEKTKGLFSQVLDNTIFNSFDTKSLMADLKLIWQQIKTTFRQQFESSKMDWMSAMARKLALEKLDMVDLHIKTYENHNFSQEYQRLTMMPNNFIENLKAIFNDKVQKFLGHVNNHQNAESAVNSFGSFPVYMNAENRIVIPVSILQPNYLWSNHYPLALKFGTLGFLLAHELIHGFDATSTKYDGNASTFNNFWDDQSAKAFRHKKQCFKHQYGRFRYNGKYLPDDELQTENVADNGAIQIAYKSYMDWLNAQPLEKLDELLPNMSLNNRQLFFLSFAQFFCADVDAVMKDKVSLIDNHAPAMYRVIGPLANFAEFSKVFKCPVGSLLNPAKKCEIF